MPDGPRQVDVTAWVERAEHDPVAYRERQATEVVLNAIARSVLLKEEMFLKGGILMGIAYGSPRQTTDIDLTTTFSAEDAIDEQIMVALNATFPRAAADLGYADLIVRAQTAKYLPKRSTFTQNRFPALKLKIAYASRGTNEAKRLEDRKASSVIDVDISFNEPLNHTQILLLNDGPELLSYGLIDLIAEKYRALLQQKLRERNRRQDVYDLHVLIREGHVNDIAPEDLLYALFVKCRARDVEPTSQSLDDVEIMSNSAKLWNSINLELETLPEFIECYQLVANFYRSLPWDSISGENSE